MRVYQAIADVLDVRLLPSRMASRRARRGKGWLPVLAMSEDGDERPWVVLLDRRGVDLQTWLEACRTDPQRTHPSVAVSVVASIARTLAPCYADGAAIPVGPVRDACVTPSGTVELGLAGALRVGEALTLSGQIHHLADLLLQLSGPQRPRALDLLAGEVRAVD